MRTLGKLFELSDEKRAIGTACDNDQRKTELGETKRKDVGRTNKVDEG